MPTLNEARDGHHYIRGTADGEHCTWQVSADGADWLRSLGIETAYLRPVEISRDLFSDLISRGFVDTGSSGLNGSAAVALKRILAEIEIHRAISIILPDTQKSRPKRLSKRKRPRRNSQKPRCAFCRGDLPRLPDRLCRHYIKCVSKMRAARPYPTTTECAALRNVISVLDLQLDDPGALLAGDCWKGPMLQSLEQKLTELIAK